MIFLKNLLTSLTLIYWNLELNMIIIFLFNCNKIEIRLNWTSINDFRFFLFWWKIRVNITNGVGVCNFLHLSTLEYEM